MQILAQKEAMKESKKKSSDEALRGAAASKTDRENMKLSLF